MKVHLLKKQAIEDFKIANARSRSSFDIWLEIIKYVDWNKPSDICETFNSADILGNDSDRVVFNIGGNEYRMICKYLFGRKNEVHIYINWIGTHAEYTKLCNDNLQYTVSAY